MEPDEVEADGLYASSALGNRDNKRQDLPHLDSLPSLEESCSRTERALFLRPPPSPSSPELDSGLRMRLRRYRSSITSRYASTSTLLASSSVRRLLLRKCSRRARLLWNEAGEEDMVEGEDLVQAEVAAHAGIEGDVEVDVRELRPSRASTGAVRSPVRAWSAPGRREGQENKPPL